MTFFKINPQDMQTRGANKPDPHELGLSFSGKDIGGFLQP